MGLIVSPKGFLDNNKFILKTFLARSQGMVVFIYLSYALSQ